MRSDAATPSRLEKVAILSDQTLFREGAAELLRHHGFQSISVHASGEALIAAAKTDPPHVILVDLDHEHEDTVVLVGTLRRALTGSRIVAVGSALRQAPIGDLFERAVETPDADAAALAAAVALSRGNGIRSAELVRQKRAWSRVTPRQRDVLRWLAIGADNESIGRQLGVGVRAIKRHVTSLLDIFQADNRAQLSLLADHAGLRPPRASRSAPDAQAMAATGSGPAVSATARAKSRPVTMPLA